MTAVPTPSRRDGALTAVRAVGLSAIALGASVAGARALGALLGLGPLSLHMMEHMALLGVAAPVAAYALQTVPVRWSGPKLAAAAATQIALLWMWHLPPVFSAAGESSGLHVLMTGSLYAAGVWFWSAVQGIDARNRWQAVMALLLTGKLFCLFAAILVFSPRLLYGLGAHAHHGHALGGIADQQLAGLIMITVCPLTYVAAGIVITVRWIAAMERADHQAVSAGSMQRGFPSASLAIVPLTALLGGCEGVQSALSPASPEAQSTFDLTMVLFVGGAAIFLAVLAALGAALFAGERGRARVADVRVVVFGGIVFPIAVLTLLLGYGLWLMRAAATPTDVEEIALQGERWWWRVTYADARQGAIASANEIRLEAGRPVRIKLTSQDVIHSFWVPALSGKVDLIPGRINEISFTPSKPGVYRGQCAEYCGGAHALMGLRVVVMDVDGYAQWLAALRKAPSPPFDPRAARGQELFLGACVGCHAVRGTIAGGRLGPDLTHVGSRAAIAAETLPMSKDNLALWIRDNERLKPGSLMPEYTHYAPADLDALATYLAGLK